MIEKATIKMMESEGCSLYPTRFKDMYDDYTRNLSADAIHTLEQLIDTAYKIGFNDGMDFRQWLQSD